jgi:hypothetical protein
MKRDTTSKDVNPAELEDDNLGKPGSLFVCLL